MTSFIFFGCFSRPRGVLKGPFGVQILNHVGSFGIALVTMHLLIIPARLCSVFVHYCLGTCLNMKLVASFFRLVVLSMSLFVPSPFLFCRILPLWALICRIVCFLLYLLLLVYFVKSCVVFVLPFQF